MWLTKKLTEEGGVKLSSGQVENSGSFAIQGESRFDRPEQVFPYGFVSSAYEGRQAVMLDGYCTGLVSAPDEELEEGEVKLYSAGGAEIVLRNDGRVIINGQVFEPQ